MTCSSGSVSRGRPVSNTWRNKNAVIAYLQDCHSATELAPALRFLFPKCEPWQVLKWNYRNDVAAVASYVCTWDWRKLHNPGGFFYCTLRLLKERAATVAAALGRFRAWHWHRLTDWLRSWLERVLSILSLDRSKKRIGNSGGDGVRQHRDIELRRLSKEFGASFFSLRDLAGRQGMQVVRTFLRQHRGESNLSAIVDHIARNGQGGSLKDQYREAALLCEREDEDEPKYHPLRYWDRLEQLLRDGVESGAAFEQAAKEFPAR